LPTFQRVLEESTHLHSTQRRSRSGCLLLCRVMDPWDPLRLTLRQLAGGPPTCKYSAKGKAKGIAWQDGERRQQLFLQRMIQPKPGGLCKTTGYQWVVLFWLGKEGCHSKVEQAGAFNVTAREGNGNWGRKGYPDTQLLECAHRQTAFFGAEKLKSCVARACIFPPPLLLPLSAVMCTSESYISLESCDSGISGTRVLMCQ